MRAGPTLLACWGGCVGRWHIQGRPTQQTHQPPHSPAHTRRYKTLTAQFRTPNDRRRTSAETPNPTPPPPPSPRPAAPACWGWGAAPPSASKGRRKTATQTRPAQPPAGARAGGRAGRGVQDPTGACLVGSMSLNPRLDLIMTPPPPVVAPCVKTSRNGVANRLPSRTRKKPSAGKGERQPPTE